LRHYRSGNLYARRRFQLFKNLFDFMGMEEDRLHFAWISAAEAELFVKTMQEVTDRARTLGPLTYLKKSRP